MIKHITADEALETTEGLKTPEDNLYENNSNKAPSYPIQVYIGNVHDNRIIGFDISLPTTMEVLLPYLKDAEISGWQDMEILEVTSDINGLGEALSETVRRTMSKDALDELNYLAARIKGLENNAYDVFAAVIGAKRYHIGTACEIINLTFTENLNQFDLMPAFTYEDYGGFLVDSGGDIHADAFNRLKDSDEPKDNELAAYIEKLEKYVDRTLLSRDAVKEENGVLTNNGLLMGGGDILSIYRGTQDIPDEHRLFTQSGEICKQQLKLDNADLAATVIKLHAVCGGNNMDFLADNLKTLVNGYETDYLLTVGIDGIRLFTATEAYMRGTEAYAFILSATQPSAFRQDITAFAVRVNEKGDNGITGDLVQLNADALYTNITRHAATPDRVDAVFSNGVSKTYDLWSWAELPSYAREDIRDYEPHFSDDALKAAANSYAAFVGANEMFCEAIIGQDVFLPAVNAAYMALSENPQPDMIRLANEAAKEILASGGADVYKLTSEGSVKLSPIEAAKALCFAEHRDLAIKNADIPALDIWAKAVAKAMLKYIHAERKQTKNRSKEDEL